MYGYDIKRSTKSIFHDPEMYSNVCMTATNKKKEILNAFFMVLKLSTMMHCDVEPIFKQEDIEVQEVRITNERAVAHG